jgi:2-keto-myo-inositol isomerase
MTPDRLAINSVTTRHATLLEALDAYAAAGFRNVEFVLPQAKAWLGEGHTVGDLKAELERRGLRSIGGFEAGLSCFGDAAAQATNHDLHLANAQLIHDLGGGTLVVGTDGPPQPSEEALVVVGQTLRGLVERMAGLDVTVAVEFNWSPLVRSFKSAVRVSEVADHERAGILFDPAHYHCTSSKLEHLTPEGVRWVRHVHMDDMRDKPGELSHCNDDRVLPGEGIVGLPALIERLEAGGYRGYWSLEMFSAELWALPAAEAARRGYESLRRLCS